MKEHSQVTLAVQDVWMFLRSSTEVSCCFTFSYQLSPCGIYVKAARGNPSKAPQFLWSKRSAARGPLWTLILRVLYKETAVFSITCPRDIPLSLSDPELSIWTETYLLCTAPTNPAPLQSLPYAAWWLPDTLEGQSNPREVFLPIQAGPNLTEKAGARSREITQDQAEPAFHSPKAASLLREKIFCIV